MPEVTLHPGDAIDVLRSLPDESIHCIVTSPPYWNQRDYGVDGQIGLERKPDEFIARLVDVFREAGRVLRDDGTAWLNLGDSYAVRSTSRRKAGRKRFGDQERDRPANPGSFWAANGLKQKDLIGIPWRVAFALQADGWYLRSDIIWEKPSATPESVRDRPTKSHEYLFLLTKSKRYHFDAKAVRESCRSGPSDVRKMTEQLPRIGGKHKVSTNKLDKASSLTNMGRKRSVGDPSGRNIRTVWRVASVPYRGAHFAVFPPKLITPCIKAGCPEGGTVLDPFTGSGTTGAVAVELGRSFVGIELNPDYLKLAEARIASARSELTVPA